MPPQVSGAERGLRLLSIDGEGILGLSPLLMLKEILYRIQQEKQLKDLPRPCDIFDLAGGTSTGGLIVVMLFRLRMSVDQAIDAYERLAKGVFSSPKWFFKEGKFKASRLEEAIATVIQEALNIGEGESSTLCMLEEEGAKCFVCAMPAGNFSFPSLFRSWIPIANQAYNCTIVEAVRATTAAPTFFKAIEFGEPIKQKYFYGALGCNNPIEYVIEEAKFLFPNRPVSCILSLGTGVADIVGLDRPNAFQRVSPTRLIKVLKGIATDCEKPSEGIARDAAQSFLYCRLSVDQGIQQVSPGGWEQLDKVQSHTLQYLRKHEVGQKIDCLVQVLKADTDAPAMEVVSTTPRTALSEAEDRAFRELKESISMSAYHDSLERSASSGCLKGTRKTQIEAIMRWIESEGKKKPTFLVLGPAGSGKTSLLNTITQICKRKGCYAAGFFFSGTDATRNTTGRLMNTIIYQIAVAIPQLQPYISHVIAADSTILSRSLDSKKDTLLLEPLRRFRLDFPRFCPGSHSFVIVVDALDECGSLEDQRRVIAALAEISDGFPLVCLLSSRFNPHVEHEISTTLTARIEDRVILGKDGDAERADIRAYLCASIDRIRDKNAFGQRIPREWLLESDLGTLVRNSGGQFIYASTVVRYIESPHHNPYERLQYVLGISTKPGEDPFAALDALYRALLSSVKPDNLAAAIEILGIQLVSSNSQFWTPLAMIYVFDFNEHFRSLDGEIVLAPLASVLKYDDGHIVFYHRTFAEFLLDSTRSQEYYGIGRMWFLVDIVYLIKEAKPGTDLHEAINDGIALVTNHPKCLPSGGNFNLWPLVTHGFVRQLGFYISIDKMANIFTQRGENFLPVPVLIKLATATLNLSNPFLLFELCRAFAALQELGIIKSFSYPLPTSSHRLSVRLTYLADYLDDQYRLGQKVLLPGDYLSASVRCLWYLQSPSRDVRSSLNEYSHSPKPLPQIFGTPDFLKDISTDLTRGALEALPMLLAQALPSVELLAALKRPFNNEVLSRAPSSSCHAMAYIHDYLMRHDPEYQRSEHTVLAEHSAVREDEPQHFEVFLHRKGSKLPFWFMKNSG